MFSIVMLLCFATFLPCWIAWIVAISRILRALHTNTSHKISRLSSDLQGMPPSRQIAPTGNSGDGNNPAYCVHTSENKKKEKKTKLRTPVSWREKSKIDQKKKKSKPIQHANRYSRQSDADLYYVNSDQILDPVNVLDIRIHCHCTRLHRPDRVPSYHTVPSYNTSAKDLDQIR